MGSVVTGTISSAPSLMTVAPSRGAPFPTTTLTWWILQPTACKARLWVQLTAGLGVCVCLCWGDLKGLPQIPCNTLYSTT